MRDLQAFIARRHASFRAAWNLQECSGMLGDLGTLLPLVLAMAERGSIAPGAALFWMGAGNVASAYAWDVPMPVQPMKTVAAAAIADGLSAGAVSAAGIFVGAAVLLLGATGTIEAVNRLVPRSVVSGIQLGLGFRMMGLAADDRRAGWAVDGPVAGGLLSLAAAGALKRGGRVPVAVLLVAAGLVLAVADAGARGTLGASLDDWRPGRLAVAFRAPTRAEWARGVLRAGLPQLPLTTLNSVISVTALSEKLFPDKRKDEAPTRKSVATSVGLMNVFCCWFGGAPACHGAGGLAGQYKFGARGGASIWVLGWLKMATALVLGDRLLFRAIRAFPTSALGALLVVAGAQLASTGVLDGAETPCLAAAAATVAFSNTGLGAAVGMAVALAERLAGRTEDASPPASSSKDDGAESKSAPGEDA
ncbi:xanthine uracil vitamin C permease [Aureococcus anophagefferens]|nr:xanthine uracil vitamin C permease [Aureococcus anophagefferens]